MKLLQAIIWLAIILGFTVMPAFFIELYRYYFERII